MKKMTLKQKMTGTIAMAAAVCVFGFSGGAVAADWQFYGTASVNTFYTKSDLADSTQFSEQLNPGAAIGAEVKVSDTLGGGFEYGTEDGSANVVLLYGVWNFGAGSLMVGQNEVPASLGISGQVFDDDRGLDGLGEFNPGERAQVSLAFGDFEIAAVEPDTQVTTAGGLDDSLSEVTIPSIQARYTFSGNGIEAGVAGAFADFDYNNQSVTSYVALASIGASVNRFHLAAQGWMGQNVGNIAPQDTMGDGEDGYAVYQSGRVYDVDGWGAALSVQMVINDMLSLEAGYGYVDLDYGDTPGLATDSDQVQTCYVNMPITLADGVQIVPEVGLIDYDEAGQDEVTYYGAKWQIEF